MENDLFKVVIVGGGSAGWMTAAYLSKVLNQSLDITVIESLQIGTIGVGEASFSTLHLFFETLGLAEPEWMPECDASYKLAIKFVNWDGNGGHFYHPFQRLPLVGGRTVAEWWHKLRRYEAPFDYTCYTVPFLCDAKRSPRYIDGTVFDLSMNQHLRSARQSGDVCLDELKLQYPYGFHFDASLLAQYLSRYAQQRGVHHLVDEVLNVALSDDGSIASLKTREHGPVTADLYIDCTGFRGLLINQLLGEPFLSYADSLLCDRAVTLPVPSKPEREGLNPYTTATALSSGWVWNIPLMRRTGSGYVYSSTFLSADAAEQELRDHHGAKASGVAASHIKMRVGRSRNSWVKNCVAIGLSSGFVEPLESTGIFFIQHGIEQLVSHFPDRAFDPESTAAYNRRVNDCMDGVREFLTLHYVASSRNDTPFWREARSKIDAVESLAARMRLWKSQMPTNSTIPGHYHGFEAYSYCVILLGLGHCPDRALPVLEHMSDTKAVNAFNAIQERARHLTSTLPSAYQYLCSMREGLHSRHTDHAAVPFRSA